MSAVAPAAGEVWNIMDATWLVLGPSRIGGCVDMVVLYDPDEVYLPHEREYLPLAWFEFDDTRRVSP